jgi:DNA (cytosine-5)-methyltransferase 1
MLKLLSLFTGIGAFEKALERLNIDYELVGFSEIDKFAIKSYCAIHNVPENKNLGDITKINIDKIPDFDLLTWGFPCQDISIAGRMEGIKKGTRSGLYYEGYKILKAKRPGISIIENVKNLTSKRFKEQFETILKDIEELGYNNYWQVLNAKNYSVPQNRERIFIVSIRKDIDKNNFVFPSPVELKLKLKDLLEDTVDDKFYLTENGIGRLIKKNNKLLKDCQNPNISSCLIAGYHKMSGNQNQYIAESNKVEKVAGLYDTENKKHQAGSIYNSNRNISNINYNG